MLSDYASISYITPSYNSQKFQVANTRYGNKFIISKMIQKMKRLLHFAEVLGKMVILYYSAYLGCTVRSMNLQSEVM